ncbi:MAG: DUF2283 domain-containing protein [Candidatus Falkowbacteria bacterium]|nr:DUF2283 domain-containing protein [Candidatus Falkowbacteria bacterium]
MDYDIESNIAAFELTKGTITHALEFGNFIVHLSKNNTPVLIEILDASKFKTKLSEIKKFPGLIDQVVRENPVVEYRK